MPYHIPWIEMSDSLADTLDYESKLDRSPDHIARLMEDGAQRARAFLAERDTIPLPKGHDHVAS
jgi:NTE family protein